MKKFKLGIVFICSSAWLISCVSEMKKNDTIKVFHRTDEAIAADDLIAKYEMEHHQLCKDESRNGSYLKWTALDDKNLDNYCRQYLEKSAPSQNTDNVTGSIIKRILCYGREKISIHSKIIIVRCKEKKHDPKIYYMTRAPEPNCAYSLRSKGTRRPILFGILYKYCDFETEPLVLRKRKRLGIISTMHHRTGQPIAKDEYLLKYELEHQQMMKEQGEEGKCFKWSYAVKHNDLTYFCNQYMKECAPGRNRDGITGSWESEKIQYQKLNTIEDVEVMTVKCKRIQSVKRNYYMTRAPEKNCVFALLRQGRVNDPLVIVFKHCDFENPSNQQQILQNNNNNLGRNQILKTEAKEEMCNTSETLQLFSRD